MSIGPDTGWANNAAADWTSIDYVGVRFLNRTAGNGSGVLNIDGLHFGGFVARVAKQAAAYSDADPCIMKVITDDYGKDDVIADEDKTGTISKLAYAEYLRAGNPRTTGTFTTRMVNSLWPGQLVHVHAKKQSGGTFRINGDFEKQHGPNPTGK